MNQPEDRQTGYELECHAKGIGTATRRTLLLAILVVAVLLRVGVALYLGSDVVAPPLLNDQISYHTLAGRLLEGHGFSYPVDWYPNARADEPTAFRSFGYVLYLAGIYAVAGVRPLAARLVGAVISGILLPWMVYRLARRIFPGREAVALVAAACAAVYAYFVLYGATLMTEAFFIIVLLWVLERAMALAWEPGPRQGLVLGLGLGLATLLRQSILPWVAVLFAWLLWTAWRSKQLQEMVASLLTSTLALTLCILPFTIRNYAVYGDFLLLNSNAGHAMFSAQHPMHGTDFQEFEAAPVPPELRGLNEAQLDRALMSQGIGFILDEPGRYILLSLSRVKDYFEFWPSPDTTLVHNLGRTGSFGLFLPFMLGGLWLALRRAWPGRSLPAWVRFSTTPLALALLFMVFYSLLHVLTWAMPRYRLPVDAVALPFAALALVELARAIRQRFTRIPDPVKNLSNTS